MNINLIGYLLFFIIMVNGGILLYLSIKDEKTQKGK